MNESQVDRMKQDLNAIQQALALEPVVDRLDIWILLVYTALGVVVSALAAHGILLTQNRVLQLCFALIMGTLTIWYTIRRYRQKCVKPGIWREARFGMVAFVVFVPAALLFKFWAKHQGLPETAIGSAVIFSFGLAYLALAIANRSRRYIVGFALPLIAIAFLFPAIIKLHLLSMSVGLFLAVSCSAMAGIIAWQLRSRRHG